VSFAPPRPGVAAAPAVAPPAWPVSLRAVVRRGVRDQWRSVAGWGASLGALGAFMAAIYPSIRETIEQVAENYPSGLREAFGVGAMDTVEGYVHAEMFSLIVPLAVGVFAIRSATRATVGAEERGRLDTVLALPLSRTVLVAGAYISTALASAAVLAATGACTWVAGRIAGSDISPGLTAAGALGVWPLAMFSAGVGILAAGALRRWGAVTAVATGTLVAMYAVDLAGRLAEGLEPLRWISAFRYYGAPLLDGIDVGSFAALTVAGVVLAVAGAVLFERRDIR
jgi:beta-exotoxin I transport system permease protein